MAATKNGQDDKDKDMHLQSFQYCSVNKVVEEDHIKMLFTLEVQTKHPVATET